MYVHVSLTVSIALEELAETLGNYEEIKDVEIETEDTKQFFFNKEDFYFVFNTQKILYNLQNPTRTNQ